MTSDEGRNDLVEELREQIDAAPVNERDEMAVSVAIERYERALNRVLDELHDTITKDSPMVVVNGNRMARDLADALGFELTT